MDLILQEITPCLPEDIAALLTPQHGREIRILLNAYQDFRERKISADDLIFESKVVLDYTWEKLNLGKWMDVPMETKQVYSIAAFIQVTIAAFPFQTCLNFFKGKNH